MTGWLWLWLGIERARARRRRAAAPAAVHVYRDRPGRPLHAAACPCWRAAA